MPSEARFPKITEAGLEDLRRRIGVKITDTLEPWCHEASRDGIRHYAHGIGDDNPLWCDPDYAARTRWGGLIAPPSFLFATSRIVSGYVGGLAGVHAMWAGADWTWHRPVRRNDTITTEAWLKELIEHRTTFAGRSIQQVYHVDFFNQHGDLVARADSWCFRTDRDEARERGTKYDAVKARPVKRYTDAELADVYRLYAAEPVRGGEPRYWQDVRAGEALPPASSPMRRAGAASTSGPTSWPGSRSTATPASASRTASVSPTAPSACTGSRSSRRWWVRRAPTTTARSAAPGSPTT
jgi:acyl dehydratase